ncbi:unnamed protein product [Closterium sp. NIES-53]
MARVASLSGGMGTVEATAATAGGAADAFGATSVSAAIAAGTLDLGVRERTRGGVREGGDKGREEAREKGRRGRTEDGRVEGRRGRAENGREEGSGEGRKEGIEEASWRTSSSSNGIGLLDTNGGGGGGAAAAAAADDDEAAAAADAAPAAAVAAASASAATAAVANHTSDFAFSEPSNDHQATTESPTSQQSSPGAAGNGVKQQRADRRVQFSRMVQVRRVLVPSDSTDSAGSFAERIREACAGPAAEAGGVGACGMAPMTAAAAAAAAAAANTVNTADCGAGMVSRVHAREADSGGVALTSAAAGFAAAAAAAGANAADAASPDAASLVPQDLANPRATDSEQEEEVKMINHQTHQPHQTHQTQLTQHASNPTNATAPTEEADASREETTDSSGLIAHEDSDSDLISPSGLPFLSISPRPSFGPAASTLSPTTSLPANASLPLALLHSSTLPSPASHSPRKFSSGPLISSLSRTLSRDVTVESTQKPPRKLGSGPLSSLSRTLSRDVTVESTQKSPLRFSSGRLISSLTRTLSRSHFKNLLSPVLSNPSKRGSEAGEKAADFIQESLHDPGTEFGVVSGAGSVLPKQVPRSVSAVEAGQGDSKARRNWLKVLRLPRAGVPSGGSKG